MRPPTTYPPLRLAVSPLTFFVLQTKRPLVARRISAIRFCSSHHHHHSQRRFFGFSRTQSQKQEQISVLDTLLRQHESHPPSSFAHALQTELLGSKQQLTESQVLLALGACQNFVSLQLKTTSKSRSAANPTSAILSLDEAYHGAQIRSSGPPIPPSTHQTPPTSSLQDSSQHTRVAFVPIAELAFEIVSHPSVFISPKVLSAYVSLQSILQDPTPIPAVFSLYANKNYTPTGSSKTVIPNPNESKNSIPQDVADSALTAAIDVKDMAACLDIIDTSYGAPAFHRAKLVREATPAIILAGLMPPLAFVIGDVLARLQNEVEHSLALGVAFTGILAYITITASLGLVAVTTANDQMVRVTWAMGTPLRYRWLREAERAAYDRVAQAWGFEDPTKSGFEEGEAWELLREVVFRKDMILDNPGLMEGME